MDELIECPYCGEENNIDTSDFPEEDITNEYECDECGKYFEVTSSVTWYYDANKLDCKNGLAPHKEKIAQNGRVFCSRCDKTLKKAGD